MSKKTIYLIGIALTIIVGTYLYSRCCCNAAKDFSDKTENLPPNYAEIAANKCLNFEYNDLKFKCSDNFRFNSDGFKAIMPVSDSINIGINTLKQYMDKNQDVELTITGSAMNKELNSSVFENMGLARANDVKNYLVSKGIDASKIKTNGKLCDFLIVEDKIVLGAINFKVSAVDNLAKVKSDYNANPIVVFFNYNKYETSVSLENQQKADALVTALKNYENAELIIVGHTDSKGTDAKNKILGDNRAQFVKNILVKNGFNAEKIKTESKGEEKPVADNNTDQGRAKNRRAIVHIK
jgi:outer membrane protein OmpA-like peptidoglycan-associated protein